MSKSEKFTDLDLMCINTIRTLSIDAIQKANSGHPGLPLGAAPFAYVLFQRHLKFNPKSPEFFDRDRFILSAGHGSMLLYSLMHIYGYGDMPMHEVKNFRQLGSKTPGHPETFMTKGVEATTGPLGQGATNAVGFAIAERKLAHLYNTPEQSVVDHFTYCLVGDGDLMEGVSAEAASLAGHLKLGKLILLYDSNDVSLDGPTSLSFTENVAMRYESYGWQVLTVTKADHDLEAIDAAITSAKADLSRPTLIIFKTTIGYGSPNKSGKSSVHGSPLGNDELQLTKKTLNWKNETAFHVPEETLAHFELAAKRGADAEATWNKTFAAWSSANPEKATQFKFGLSGNPPANLDALLPEFAAGEELATRESSGKVLNAIAAGMPTFFGGDADLSCSTNTFIKDGGSFEGQNGSGRNIHYGVREHAMAAIANGIAYHGGLRTFTATFFCFFDYMKPAVRLAAMNHLPVTFIYTHDSIALGEDGPTHQPIEHLMSLRTLPNSITLRPCDANEVSEAWAFSMKHKTGPVSLVLSRQKVKNLDRKTLGSAKGLHRGAYILKDAPHFRVILIATGAEVGLALEVEKLLAANSISARVISMPSVELFLAQPDSYRETVLPHAYAHRVSIEAGTTFGWREIIGSRGLAFGVNSFGASAPAPKLFEKFGLTPTQIAERVTSWLNS